MEETQINAERLLRLMEHMRPHLLGPAFAKLREFELSPSHLRLLRALDGERSLPMKDLADQLCIKPPSVTGLTRRLLETGLVDRQSHAADSRLVLIQLTEEGRNLHRKLHEEQLAGMTRMLTRLTPEEQETLLTLLERAVD